MSARLEQEARFVAMADALALASNDVGHVLRRLDDWLGGLRRDLAGHAPVWPGLREDGEIAREARALDARMNAVVGGWAEREADLGRAQALAERFDARIVLLVFGKFNAGKSAFCNLLAERFASHGSQARYFHIEDGRIVQTPERFVEGATEATARLQGVYLAERLVLLDTPGLHSVTGENAALTRRFTDSADGVLWLTSSTSPGQVQELDELARELQRGKPLLPVITRSDVFEEDELDGDIVKILRNKTTDNRALQQADVQVRAQAKLRAMGVDQGLLRPPVSVSAHMAREHGQSPAALADAGFAGLYEALNAIVGPAVDYRRRKAAEMRLHHLEEHVFGALQAEIAPRLQHLDATLQAARARLEPAASRIAAAIWRGVVPALPGLLQDHADSADARAVCTAAARRLTAVAAHAVETVLGAEYRLDAGLPRVCLSLAEGVGYERITLDGDDPDVGPSLPQGEPLLVGVSHERLHAALQDEVQRWANRLADHAAAQAEASLLRLADGVAALGRVLRDAGQALDEAKARLRTQDG
ncbi:hypothetical protein FOZ76_16360 [Verticiella sediminum]|uniref:Dynamin N-terminal domain-containing protein n=1 Tax=Verticiella sediminum TaxID=1247510 RepID=A0A556AJB5_9BURK|nr:dynamin family protein [Verticiella sediminum]TSH92959.1 hypothetical protein FOZ76_16360 [Verticiella sediminum]